MTRSPLSYPLNRGMDMEAGGAADLQTDVMRFMAILSLCLVAIFALVQSLPMTPPAPVTTKADPDPKPTAEPPPERPMPVPERVVREPVLQQPPPPEPRRVKLPPAPVYEPVKAPEPEPTTSPPLASSVAPVPEPAPAPAASEAAKEGFTLRFESDLALRRLVARNEIGLYAMRADKAFRMNVNRGALSFWPASNPSQFHEMDEATVPNDVVAALRRTGAPGTITWGVTLPSKLSSALNRYLTESRGGELIIDGDGAMRLEK